MTDLQIFLAGLFISVNWLIFAVTTISEFRKM